MKPAVFRLLFLPVATLAVFGAEPASVDASAARGWSLRGEAAARVQHDSNVYLQDGGALAPSATSPGAPARADAVVGALSLGAGLASPVGAAGRLTFDYHLDLVRFDGFLDENHDDHRLRAALVGARDSWTWDVNGSVLVVDGSDVGPVYRGLGGGPALGGEPVRSRRDQTVSKGAARVTRAHDGGWVRALASSLYQDFHTEFDSIPGCSAYVDRGESTAGFEAGLDMWPGFAFVAGVCAGVQRQADRPPADDLNSSATLVRVLVGVEGKPTRSLKLDLRVGPEFHRFGDDEPAALDRERVAPFAEASATWTPGAADTITLGGKHALWLCSSGRGAYEDSTWDLAWKHRVNEQLSTRLGGRVALGDSKRYAYPGTRPFRDGIYSVVAGIDYRLAKNTVLDASLSRDEGDSRLRDRPGREYTRVQVGLGVTQTW